MKVAIVEDYTVIADTLAAVCRNDFNFEVVVNEPDGKTALRLILELKPNLVILDVSLPDMDGLAVARTILSKLPATKILVFTAMLDPVTLDRVRKLGVHGFAHKLQTIAALKNAIDLVSRGHYYFAPVMNESAKAQRSNPRSFTRILSDYEQHVLSLIGESKSDEEIGKLIAISPMTVQSRRRDIMKKLDIHSTPKLIRYAIEQGFTRPGYFPRESNYAGTRDLKEPPKGFH
jgi:DNA-binding NarL/FixJ family response regulator